MPCNEHLPRQGIEPYAKHRATKASRHCEYASRYLLPALLVFAASAQLPPSSHLSGPDEPQFRAEIDRLDKELAAFPDNCWIMNEMARTWAAAQQYPETMKWLERIAALGVGLDPSRDPLYKVLHGSREFEAVIRKTREATEPISTSHQAFRIAEGDLTPESSAYDLNGHRFYFGSIRKGSIVSCDASGNCVPFTAGQGTVLGVKISQGHLWAVSNKGDESSLIEFSLITGKQERTYVARGKGHRLNDIAISPSGDLFTTDTAGGSVWKLPRGADKLEPFMPNVRFRFANGIAVANDGSLLYVSSYPDGITVVDLKTGTARPIAHAAGLCLALIDGLYFYKQSLIAVQNGSMTPRVSRFYLTKDLRSIARFEVLERRNELFDGITGGTIAGNDFYYPANIQDDKPSGARFNPIVVLRTHL